MKLTFEELKEKYLNTYIVTKRDYRNSFIDKMGFVLDIQPKDNGAIIKVIKMNGNFDEYFFLLQRDFVNDFQELTAENDNRLKHQFISNLFKRN
jgi:hypothetical protein